MASTRIGKGSPWRHGAALLLVVLAACQQEKVESRPPTPLDLATAGTISGEIRVQGAVPESTALNFGSADCKAQHQGPINAGDVLVHDGKVANALVYIKEGLGDRVFAVPSAAVDIDQKGCLFEPRVAAAQVGQPVRFLNSDPLAHNVHGTPQLSRGWNFSLGLKGAARATTIPKAELIEIKCDIHPWMKAYLRVFDHPYFAVTGPDGRFSFEHVPPGRYVIEAWHERFGMRTAEVTLGEKETKEVALTFSAAAAAR